MVEFWLYVCVISMSNLHQSRTRELRAVNTTLDASLLRGFTSDFDALSHSVMTEIIIQTKAADIFILFTLSQKYFAERV